MNTGTALDRSFRLALMAFLALGLSLGLRPAPVYAAQPSYKEAQPTTPTRFEGYLRAIGPGKWLVGMSTVVVDAQTVVVEKRGRAEVGAWVIVWGDWDEAGRVRAELIQVDRPAGRTGPTLQFSGQLQKIAGGYWVIEQMAVKITATTLVTGDPVVGALVWVVAEQQDDNLVAIAAEIIAQSPEATPVEFEGPIQAIGPEFWMVDERRVQITARTVIIGDPALDKNAEVKATTESDGERTAHLIRVVNPDAEARLSAMVAAIATEPDGAQTWEVLIFPEEPWADPEIGVLHVDANTFVDESRATAQAGHWAEVRGVELELDHYQADVVRLEQPAPVSLAGEFTAAPAGTGGPGWWQIDGQPVWVANAGPATAAAAYAGGNVTVIGVRLGNGVIWTRQVRSPEGRTR